MTDLDPFSTQRRFDDFRAALGVMGAHLDAGPNVDALLTLADRHGWTGTRIGQAVAASLAGVRGAGVGLALSRLAEFARNPEPAPVSDHAREAAGRSGRWRQPRPPCGACDGTNGRWIERAQADDYAGQLVVEHCPFCWTPPPGYVDPVERNRRALAAIYGVDAVR